MRIRRLLGTVVATTLVATPLTLVAAGTAAAVDTVETRIVAGTADQPMISSYSTPIEYGDDLSVSINVEALINGVWTEIYNGSVVVTEQVAGQAPTTVAQASTAYLHDTIPTHGNATYTVAFGGGTGGYPQVNYAPSSATFQLDGVQRAMGLDFIRGKHAGFKLKLSPATRTKVVVSRKQGKKFKKFKQVHTNGKGRVSVILPAPNKGKFIWKIAVSGDSRFSGSEEKIVTYRGF